MTDEMTPADDGAHLRSVEVEVTATPAQVWDAIATADGNAGWSFPTEIEGRVGGEVRIHRQPYGGTAIATVVAWDPPHRLAYDEPRTTVPGGTDTGEPWTTELLVEARSGGTCIVRVVSGFRRHGEAWEEMVDGAAEGWSGALSILRGYLAHFAGQPVAVVDATVTLDRPAQDASAVGAELFASLGLAGLDAGDPFESPAGPPPLAGVVDQVSPVGLLLRVTAPAPALAEVSGFAIPGMGVLATVALRYYGEGAQAAAAEHGPRWQEWIASVGAAIDQAASRGGRPAPTTITAQGSA
jgi:uncharacterized protein YndB with AHSA1/START domain